MEFAKADDADGVPSAVPEAVVGSARAIVAIKHHLRAAGKVCLASQVEVGSGCETRRKRGNRQAIRRKELSPSQTDGRSLRATSEDHKSIGDRSCTGFRCIFANFHPAVLVQLDPASVFDVPRRVAARPVSASSDLTSNAGRDREVCVVHAPVRWSAGMISHAVTGHPPQGAPCAPHGLRLQQAGTGLA